jgi:hypothetical protein
MGVAGAEYWKTLAWNGITLRVPCGWDPARVGARHLLLESPGGPAMEIKWGPVRGRFSHRVHLKRIGRQLPGGKAGAACEWPLPDDWKPALARFDSLGFRWRGAGICAEGAILHCPACRTATLVQFFQPPGAGAAPAAAAPAAGILASLRDHRQDDRVDFAVFDLRLQVPGRYALRGQRFDAGRFRLDFADARNRLSYFRWAPAQALLGGGTLEEFARRQGFAELEFSPFAEAGRAGIEGREPGAGGVSARLMAFLGTRPACRARLWPAENRNRILGVRVTGRREIPLALLEELCAGYDVEANPAPAAGDDAGAGAAVHSR